MQFLKLAILSEVRVRSKFRGLRFFFFLALFGFFLKSAHAQDWFRTAIGMDANKPRVAIAEERGDRTGESAHAQAAQHLVAALESRRERRGGQSVPPPSLEVSLNGHEA